MRALTRSPWTALALLLGLVLSAGAAEQKVPGALPAVPGGAPAAVVPSLPQLPLSVGAQEGLRSLPADATVPALATLPASAPSAPALPLNPIAQAIRQAAAPQAAAAHIPAAQAGTVQLPGAGKAPLSTPSLGGESTSKIIEQLAPENAARVSGEQASELAGELIDPRVAGDGALGVDASGGAQPSGVSLAPWQRHGGRGSWLVPQAKAAAIPTRPEAAPTLAEKVHYDRLFVENLRFYIVTNIRNKWAPYYGYWKKLKASGTPAPVSQPRKFFAYMRVFGQTGEFYIPGFTPLEDDAVVKEALETYDRFFDAPYLTKREREAFEGFVMRASVYNKERRAASKFRATVRDNLLKASTMPKEKIAPFFDSLPTVDKTVEFQSKDADAVLEKMRGVLLEEIAKEPKDAKDRVTGVILIGSFALGAATPKSDFDLEPLTADGGSGRVREFAARVTKRWEELGRQTTNPVSFHYFGYLESRWEIRAIHHEPYLIISPDQALVEKLAMRPGEPPSHVPSRKLTRWGSFLRWLQYAAVTLTSYTVRPQKL